MTTLVDNWESHWDLYARSAERNPAQTYRRKLIFDLLPDTPDMRLLDVGSGQGDFARELRRRRPDCRVLGLELSASGVEISQRKVPGGTFLQTDLLKPYAGPQSYREWATHAVCSEMLEHVEDPSLVLKNLQPLLAPEAQLVVTVPGGPRSAFDRHIGHRQHFTAQSLQDLAQRSGYRVESLYCAGFPFFNLYKLVVILRGKKLITDVAATPAGDSGFLAEAVMAVFRFLFVFNSRRLPWGWQLVAVLRRST